MPRLGPISGRNQYAPKTAITLRQLAAPSTALVRCAGQPRPNLPASFRKRRPRRQHCRERACAGPPTHPVPFKTMRVCCLARASKRDLITDGVAATRSMIARGSPGQGFAGRRLHVLRAAVTGAGRLAESGSTKLRPRARSKKKTGREQRPVFTGDRVSSLGSTAPQPQGQPTQSEQGQRRRLGDDLVGHDAVVRADHEQHRAVG